MQAVMLDEDSIAWLEPENEIERGFIEHMAAQGESLPEMVRKSFEAGFLKIEREED